MRFCLSMSDIVLNVQDTEQRFSFFKKHTKASKISRVSVQQNFAHKGWNSCDTQFDSNADESEYDIKSSPTNFYKTSYKRIPIQDEYSKKKPMLVEISNIESLFKENEIKFLQESSCQNYSDFKKNLCKKEKVFKDSLHKRITSTSLNFEDVKATFQFKKEHIRESKISDDPYELISDYSPSKISCHKKEQTHEKEQTNKWNKLKNSFEAFINNSFGEKCMSKNIDSGNFIKDNFIPVKVKSLKMSSTAHSLDFVKEKNETHITPSSIKLKNGNFDSNKLKKSSNSDQIISKSNCETSQMPFVKESETLTNNYSDLNGNCINIINDESSPEVKSPNILCTPLSVAKVQSFKNMNETLKCENLNENVDSNNYINYSYKFPNSSNDICNSISMPCIEENETFISKYSSDYSTDSNKICQESSPEQAKSPEIDCMPQSVVSIQHFEEDKGASTYNQNCVLDAQSTVFENKTFMKSEMNFKERCSSASKGSNWVQSLNWSDISLTKDSTSDNCDLTRRKILKNIIQGGFAEQMLKLQRRERSDRVIWNHKETELKKKASGNSVTLTLVSFIYIGQIIVTKCYASEKEEERIKEFLCTMEVEDSLRNSLLSIFDKLQNASCDNTFQNLGWKPFIVLFKKAIFSKLCLKPKDMFVLYPPWQMLYGTSLPVPVILCTYYVDNLYKSMDIPTTSHPIHSQPVTYYSLQSEELECKMLKLSNTSLDNSFDLYGRCVCIAARVQRIWKNFIINDKIQDMLKIDFLGYSLLLQSEDGIFLELQINSIDLSPSYQQFLSDAEGHCFKFCDIVMSHRFNINKCHELSKIMEFILKETKTNVALSTSQLYCYQFIPSSLSKLPSKISDENFPEYCDLEIKSLSFIQKNNLNGARVSCIGKVLFQNGNDFCICDESLLSSKLQKYCKVKFASIKQLHKPAIVGASVLIKEAVINEGFLLMDKFSSWEIISSAAYNKLILSCEPRLKKIGLITSELILSPLSLSSKVKEFVLVKGIITEVDENSAISWLECSQCLKENLLEDSNSVIYCEDCSCIVSNPILKVRMEVTVHSEDLPIAKIKIQLQSSTIKRILNIKEDNYNPQCNISDVFKKSTGDLSCYVRAIETVNKQKVFYLKEMICS